MLFRVLSLCVCIAIASSAHADEVQNAIDEALKGLKVVVSDDPYSRTIQRMYIGWNDDGEAVAGIAHRRIESHKPLTGVVIVHKTAEGFTLHEALFPDIGKIKNAKHRKEVLSVLKQFSHVSFDPHAEKSAVDTVSGATRYGLKTTGYLNFMARRIAIELETLPRWTKPE